MIHTDVSEKKAFAEQENACLDALRARYHRGGAEQQTSAGAEVPALHAADAGSPTEAQPDLHCSGRYSEQQPLDADAFAADYIRDRGDVILPLFLHSRSAEQACDNALTAPADPREDEDDDEALCGDACRGTVRRAAAWRLSPRREEAPANGSGREDKSHRSLPEAIGGLVGVWMRDWVRFEGGADRSRGTRRPFPLSAAALILTTAIALGLVIGGSVLVSGAGVDKLAAEEHLQTLQEEAQQLEVTLDAKYDPALVENLARNTYGMIDGAYVTQRYLTMSGEDTVETVEDEPEATLFAALLCALGIGGR